MSRTENPFRWSIPAGSRTAWSRLQEPWPWTTTTAGASAASAGSHQPLTAMPASRLGRRTSSGSGIRYGAVPKSPGGGPTKAVGSLPANAGGQSPTTVVSLSQTKALAAA